MNDREVLEDAAKAIGMKVFDWMPGRSGFAHGDSITNRWNPLADDGDALRLAVRLGIQVEPSPRGCSVMWPCPNGLRVETILNNTIGADSETSTRRAIVRAAAAMAVGDA